MPPSQEASCAAARVLTFPASWIVPNPGHGKEGRNVLFAFSLGSVLWGLAGASLYHLVASRKSTPRR